MVDIHDYDIALVEKVIIIEKKNRQHRKMESQT